MLGYALFAAWWLFLAYCVFEFFRIAIKDMVRDRKVAIEVAQELVFGAFVVAMWLGILYITFGVLASGTGSRWNP